MTEQPERPDQGQMKLLVTLQRLLEMQATEVKTALNQASQLLAEALNADKIDIFLYESASNSLVAIGTSQTPLSELQRSLGLDRLPVANDGRSVEVFQTGNFYHTGHADQDLQVLLGIREALGVRSMIAVPLDVDTNRRGVVSASTTRPEAFTSDDVRFLEAVSHWIGMVLHRAELVEQIQHDAIEQTHHSVANDLISVLAHDLRNHIAPMRGRLDLIRKRAHQEQRSKDIRDSDAALSSLERLQQMIKNMLDSTRLEQGLFSFDVHVLDIVDLVQETAAMLRTDDRDIQVLALQTVCVEVDPERIRQALENLLSNAMKYSPKGLPVIIEVRTQLREQQWALIHVRDQGPGVPSDLRPRIFERFVSGENSTGLGLGLYIAHGIVTAHGGTIAVESNPGTGTTFTIALPIPASLIDRDDTLLTNCSE